MEASRLRTLMMKSRLLPLALCFLSLFLILGVQGYAQSCDGMTTGVGGSLNGFLPFSNVAPSLYGPSAWNYPVVDLTTNPPTLLAPLDPNSDAIIAQINKNDKIGGGAPSKLHPDFGPEGGMPYTIVDSSVQPFVDIIGLNAGTPPGGSQSDAVVEPAPPDAPIEGQQPACLDWPATQYYFGDTHMLIVDRYQCFLYETYLTSECNGQISAGGQAIWDLQNGEVRPYGWTSTDAAGLPVWPGLLKFDEACTSYVNDPDNVNNDGNCAATQPINHAFRFTVNRTKGDSNGGYFVFPAGHAANGDYGYKYLNVMGMRMILKPSTNISSFSPINQTILTAMMQYGLILADNGSDMYVTGTTDPRWNTNDLGDWHGGSLTGAGAVDCGTLEPGDTTTSCYITSADFEVIQMSPEDVNQYDITDGVSSAEAYSYMDANSAPYTVADVEAGVTAAGDNGYPYAPWGPTPVGTTITGGLGPEGTALYPLPGTGESGSDPCTVPLASCNIGNNNPSTPTSGLTPVISSPAGPNTFEAHYVTGGGGNLCGTVVTPSLLGDKNIEFTANVTGSTYQYIDNAGPFRVNSAGNGIRLTTLSNTQTYTLYAMNPSGMTVSEACTLYTANGMLPIPILSPATGTYNNIITVTISDPGYPGAAIYYTTDQTVPTNPPTGTTTAYTGPITISSTSNLPCGPPASAGCNYLNGEQINAIAVDPTGTISTPSGVGAAVYVVNGQAAAPIITPQSGTYTTDNAPLLVTFADSTNPIDVNTGDGNVTFIYYTTDGTTPGGDQYGDPTGTSLVCAVGPNTGGNDCAQDGLLGAGQFTLPTGVTTVNAAANALGYTLSPVTTVTYNEMIEYFTVTVAPSTITIDPTGNASAVGVTVASLGGYTGTVNLSCSGLPPGDVCMFNPASVTVGTNPGLSVLTISAGANSRNHSFPLLPGGATLAVALCFFGLRKRRMLQLVVLLSASVIGLSLFTGCGTPGSVPNTVTVTITGTDSNGLATVNSYLTVTQMQSQ